MKRRSFLSGLLATLSGLGLVKSAKPETKDLPTPDKPILYQGYRVYWTGWKGPDWVRDQDILVGQWLAVPGGWRDSNALVGYYSSIPGGCGPYLKGNVFDISCQDDQLLIDSFTTKEQRDVAMWKALERLKKLLDGKAETARYVQDYQRPKYRFGFTGWKNSVLASPPEPQIPSYIKKMLSNLSREMDRKG